MVEYIARYLDELGIPSLILSRGYAGGDEAKMLERHLLHTSVKIGVGANRNATAAAMFERYGFMDLSSRLYSGSLSSPCKLWSRRRTQKIGVVILDDGMQGTQVESCTQDERLLWSPSCSWFPFSTLLLSS
ncbi:hypothetical protein KSP40_PGU014833 [Platanthera guangdongensis]|uniref:tetraacyldisaccharide 4'-kinase n=1 Tax=Platanthera guangdongensis TaxID=2320717 RepID=A0ABR2MB69_9ASPA